MQKQRKNMVMKQLTDMFGNRILSNSCFWSEISPVVPIDIFRFGKIRKHDLVQTIIQHFYSNGDESILNDDLSHIDDNGKTAIHKALENNSCHRTIRAMLKHFPQAVNVLDYNEESPMCIAIKNEKISLETVKVIYEFAKLEVLQKTDNFGYNLLHEALVHERDISFIAYITDKFKTMCCERTKNNKYGHGFENTPLHIALICGSSIEIIKLLLSTFPAAILMCNDKNETLLHTAIVHKCSTEIVNFLIMESLTFVGIFIQKNKDNLICLELLIMHKYPLILIATVYECVTRAIKEWNEMSKKLSDVKQNEEGVGVHKTWSYINMHYQEDEICVKDSIIDFYAKDIVLLNCNTNDKKTNVKSVVKKVILLTSEQSHLILQDNNDIIKNKDFFFDKLLTATIDNCILDIDYIPALDCVHSMFGIDMSHEIYTNFTNKQVKKLKCHLSQYQSIQNLKKSKSEIADENAQQLIKEEEIQVQKKLSRALKNKSRHLRQKHTQKIFKDAWRTHDSGVIQEQSKKQEVQQYPVDTNTVCKIILPITNSKCIDPINSECCVCMENSKTHILIPCAHMCVCNACADDLLKKQQLCPICRSEIQSIYMVFV